MSQTGAQTEPGKYGDVRLFLPATIVITLPGSGCPLGLSGPSGHSVRVLPPGSGWVCIPEGDQRGEETVSSSLFIWHESWSWAQTDGLSLGAGMCM